MLVIVGARVATDCSKISVGIGSSWHNFMSALVIIFTTSSTVTAQNSLNFESYKGASLIISPGAAEFSRCVWIFAILALTNRAKLLANSALDSCDGKGELIQTDAVTC